MKLYQGFGAETPETLARSNVHWQRWHLVGSRDRIWRSRMAGETPTGLPPGRRRYY
jgi:hypothetical protein